jgi:rare lipoprotein A
MSRRGARAAALVLLAACVHAPPTSPPDRPPTREDRPAPPPRVERPDGEVGMASFYGRAFHGRRTASGARYDMHALTCAHPTAPFGTRLRVTDLESGRSIVVVVNDRGPFARGRVIDLSLEAARRLGMVERGVVRVRVERLGEEPSADARR